MYYSQVQTVILLYGLNLVVPSSSQYYVHLCLVNSIEELPYDPTEWIEQPLDHFNDSDPRTFTAKYYKILKYWKPDGPVLLFLQGLMPLPEIIFTETHSKDHVDPIARFFVNEIVEETGAALFISEHRYFGESSPFLDFTDESLRFLTTRQALADTFNLLTTIKKTPEFQNSKVMVVGGSYAGNLAVWLKQMYPELIDAVLANSAPLLAKLDYEEAFETVTETFRTYGSQECVDKITEIFNTYHELFQSPEGAEKIKQEFNICEDDNMTIPLNQQSFYDFLSYYNFFIQAMRGTPPSIHMICKGIISSELEQQQFFAKNYDPLIGFSSFCSEFDLKTNIDTFNTLATYLRREPFLSCNEFGSFVTTSSSKNMFGSNIPLDYYITQCKLFFGEEFDEERVEQGVINTNRMYGGLTPNVTKVVFVNGDMDPWHRLSIVQDLSADAPAIFIKGSSQCSIFYPDEYDSDNLKDARKRIINLLKKWIGQA